MFQGANYLHLLGIFKTIKFSENYLYWIGIFDIIQLYETNKQTNKRKCLKKQTFKKNVNIIYDLIYQMMKVKTKNLKESRLIHMDIWKVKAILYCTQRVPFSHFALTMNLIHSIICRLYKISQS